MNELAVFIPTRHRRERAEECIKSFRETTSGLADLFLVVDDDDRDYDDIDVPVIVAPRGTLVTAINKAALWLADEYKVLMLAADDQVFLTKDWDIAMLESLDALGGSGMVFPDDRRRYDVPEHVMISSDIVKSLGWFAEPGFAHFFIDNVWAELGNRGGIIRFCQEAVIEHRHYSVTPGIERDAVYSEAEIVNGPDDQKEFLKWQAERSAEQIAKIRREFNRDLKWVLDKI